MPRKFPLILIYAALLYTSAPAAYAGETTGKTTDPNEKICETITPTGSRLGGRRVCATQAE